MPQEGIAPDKYTVGSFVNLAKADASSGAVTLARAVFDATPRHQRNQRVYALMMSAEARVGRGVAAMQELLVMAGDDGVQANAFMLNAALQAGASPEDVLEMRAQLSHVAGDEVSCAERGAERESTRAHVCTRTHARTHAE